MWRAALEAGLLHAPEPESATRGDLGPEVAIPGDRHRLHAGAGDDPPAGDVDAHVPEVTAEVPSFGLGDVTLA